ncbi:MAG: hypothetical protein AAF889_08490, partial [Cyanobacteria bacterium P01_D01_bin.73]
DGIKMPSTLISGDEAVKVAVQRMTPALKSRLAEKWLHLTDNCYQSAIAFQSRLLIDEANSLPSRYPFTAGTPPFSAPETPASPPTSRATPRKSGSAAKSSAPRNEPYALSVPTLPIGAPLRIQISCQGDRPLYPLVFAFDAMGGSFGYLPGSNQPLEPGTMQTLLQDSPWMLPGQKTTVNSYVLMSPQPWKQVREQWDMMQRQGSGKGGAAGMMPLENPVTLARAAINDLGAACALSLPGGDGGDRPLLDLRKWVTLRLSYRVV